MAAHTIYRRSVDLLAISMPSSLRVELTPEYYSLKKFLKDSGQPTLSVGFLGNETYPNGKQVGDVARKNEFGDVGQNQPPRPFMRPAMDNASSNAADLIGKGIAQSISSDKPLNEILNELGQYSAAEVIVAIKNVHDPELAPRTIRERRKRGNMSVKPLEDTHMMINSVNYEVTK